MDKLNKKTKTIKRASWRNLLTLPYTEQMFTAFTLAILVGYVLQGFPSVVEHVFQPLSHVFLIIIKIMVVPLMVASIANAIITFWLKGLVGRLIGRSFLYFFLTSLAAVAVSLLLSGLMSEVYPLFQSSMRLPQAASRDTMVERIVNVFLDNLLSASTSGSVLLFLCIAFVLGFVLLQMAGKQGRIHHLVEKSDEIIRKVLAFYWKMAPWCMFFMFTPIVASYGAEIVGNSASLIGACYMCFFIHALVVYVPCVYLRGGINPLQFIGGMIRPLMFAMSTESSIATLPYNVRATVKMGVRREISRLVLPLGATFNMDGSAIYMVVASVFAATCYGIDLTAVQFLTIGVVSLALSFCVVGIPGGSLALLPLVFAAAGIPLEGVAIVAVADRVVDMGGTMVSVMGDATCALMMDKMRG